MNQSLGTSFSSLASMVVIGFSLIFSGVRAEASGDLKIVANEKVCMVTDMYFGKKQIPVTHAGKTYFGCCENCKETLSKDEKARIAKDPVTGRVVDKAKAVIAASSDNSVLYFENKNTFEEYKSAVASLKSSGKPKSSGGHSHH